MGDMTLGVAGGTRPSAAVEATRAIAEDPDLEASSISSRCRSLQTTAKVGNDSCHLRRAAMWEKQPLRL
jgi:hypothetical protein